MSWVTIIWAMIASACLTLAMMHLIIWVQQTWRRAHLLFSVTAISVAAVVACELLLMRAQTTEQFGTVMRWAHVPLFFTVVSIVGFVRLYLRAGRPWLGYTVCGVRLLVLIRTSPGGLDIVFTAGPWHNIMGLDDEFSGFCKKRRVIRKVHGLRRGL
jgi:two-component system, LuxR family, sensor kinase FixL